MQTPFAVYDALSAIAVPPEKVRAVVQSLEHDMAQFASRSHIDQLDQFSNGQFSLLRAENAGLRNDMATMEKRIDQRFEQVDRRFDDLQELVAANAKGTGERFDRLAAQVNILKQELKTELKHELTNALTVRMAYMMAGLVAVLVSMSQLLK
jgi:hypothetical protein